MGLLKKIAICGCVCLLSASMVACNGKTTDTMSDNVTTGAAVTEGEATTEGNMETGEDVPIAKVGDTEILKSELEIQLNYQKMYLMMSYGEDFLTTDNGKEYVKELKNYLVDNLISMKIAEIKADEVGQVPSDEDVEKAYEEQKANYGSEEEFKSALEESKMTEDDLKKEIKTAMIAQNMNVYLGKDATVTDDEAKQYYQDHIDEYTDKAGANISHILVETEEEAKKVKSEYDAGTSFADLASKYGTDGTKSTGGALGYIPYSTKNYDADFMAAAKKLGEGEVSDPVKTQFGWHLIKVEGIKKEDVVKAFDEVKDEASAACLKEKQNKMITEQLDKWKDELGVTTYEDAIAAVE